MTNGPRRLLLYNGSTGGIGRHVATAARGRMPAIALTSRMEDRDGLGRELERLPAAKEVVFLQLAALVSVPACEADPAMARRLNSDLPAEVTSHVLDWCASRELAARVIFVSSGHVYAPPQGHEPLTEDAQTEPRSVYAVTKLAGERAVAAAAGRFGRPVSIARVFGIIGPDQPDNYILPGLVRRVLAGDMGAIPGLDYQRDYLDTRDVAACLVDLAAAQWPRNPFTVNVCSGLAVSIRELLRAVLAAAEVADPAGVAAAIKGADGRPTDVPWLVGDPSTIESLLGRSAKKIELYETAAEAVARMQV